MIRSFLTSLLLIGLVVLAYITDVFAILSHSIMLYIAIGLLITVLTVTVIVLKMYAEEEAQNEKDNK